MQHCIRQRLPALALACASVHAQDAAPAQALAAASAPRQLAVGAKPELKLPQPVLDSGVLPLAGKLPDVPTVVLTAMRQAEKPEFFLETPQALALKRDLHADVVRQFSAGTQVVTTRRGHNIQLEEPELVIEAVRNVIAEPDAKTDGKTAQAGR